MFISQIQQAQTLVDIYASRLDHYLYCILGKTTTLQAIRKLSPLLLAAVCTVGALHAPETPTLFYVCYQQFRAAAANIALSENASLDDIRGLCIGAFWLRDIAWNLSSIAVSLATKQQLHQASITEASHDQRARERTRLYYLVYVCDHHFSIAYGRPPMTRESELTNSSKDFLALPESTEDDARLVSQVQMWSIASQGLSLMGFNIDAPVPENLVPSIRRLMISLDTWRADWSECFGLHVNVGDYPRKGVKLHYHFAKLYLCSHAYRGLDPELNRSMEEELSNPSTGPRGCEPRDDPSSTSVHERKLSLLSPDLEEIAESAVDSAQSILRIITSDEELQAHLNGLPLYFDTMIAFAIVFLLKVGMRYSRLVKNGASGSLELIRTTAGTLGTVAKTAHQDHFLAALAPAVHKLLRMSVGDHWQGQNDQSNSPRPGWQASVVGSPAVTFQATDYNGQSSGTDWNFDWTDFDFLATTHDPLTGLF